MGHVSADFSGDVAVVTGAASGIGLAILNALCEAGAKVHGFDVQGSPADVLAGGDRPVKFHQVDVSSTGEVQAAVGEVFDADGRIDLLINNAGITRDHMLWKISDSDWKEVLDVNLAGAHRMLRAIVPSMRERGRGRIVQVASINGLRGKAGQANYIASKAGLIGLTRAAARELGPDGITVNAVAPGMIETPLVAELPTSILEQAKAESARGQLGQPQDVAAAVLYLLSEEAAHVTGTVLTVDGGQLS